MSDENAPDRAAPPTPQEVVAVELRRYGDALIPGAAEVLAQRNQHIGHMTPDKRAEKVAELIASPLWSKFRNPEHAPPKLENGQPFSPVRAALARHQEQLRPGVLDALTEKLSASMVGKSPSQVAGAVVKFLQSREADGFKTGYTIHSPVEERLAGAIHSRFSDVMTFDAAKRFVVDRRGEIERLPDRQLTVLVAGALSAGAVATKYGATRIQPGDPRLIGQGESVASPGQAPPQAPPRREPDGRFATPPASKPRGPSSGF